MELYPYIFAGVFFQTTKGGMGRKAWPMWVHAMSPGCSVG